LKFMPNVFCAFSSSLTFMKVFPSAFISEPSVP
jgi:hypothetical protein